MVQSSEKSTCTVILNAQTFKRFDANSNRRLENEGLGFFFTNTVTFKWKKIITRGLECGTGGSWMTCTWNNQN